MPGSSLQETRWSSPPSLNILPYVLQQCPRQLAFGTKTGMGCMSSVLCRHPLL
jgi:hypothetical protein